jgi:hypothetical protein
MENAILQKQIELIGKVSHAIIRRINYPKGKPSGAKSWQDINPYKISRALSLDSKTRPTLTEQEENDVQQTVAFVLIATGALEREDLKLNFNDWKAAFSEVRGINCLGIDRRSKNQSEIVNYDTMTDADLYVASVKFGLHRRVLVDEKRKAIARRIRFERACVFAKFAIDNKRKRRCNLRRCLTFIRFTFADYGQKHLSFPTKGNDASALRHKKKDFEKYRDEGAAILTERALANLPARTLSDFSQIGANPLTEPEPVNEPARAWSFFNYEPEREPEPKPQTLAQRVAANPYVQKLLSR